jgi:hypothetical protein
LIETENPRIEDERRSKLKCKLSGVQDETPNRASFLHQVQG